MRMGVRQAANRTYSLFCDTTHASPFLALTISKGEFFMSCFVASSSNLRPISRLTANLEWAQDRKHHRIASPNQHPMNMAA